jgi:hypothetical protein
MLDDFFNYLMKNLLLFKYLGRKLNKIIKTKSRRIINIYFRKCKQKYQLEYRNRKNNQIKLISRKL